MDHLPFNHSAERQKAAPPYLSALRALEIAFVHEFQGGDQLAAPRAPAALADERGERMGQVVVALLAP